MTIQENLAIIAKNLRNQAKDDLAMADFLEGLKITDTPAPATPPVQEEKPKK